VIHLMLASANSKALIDHYTLRYSCDEIELDFRFRLRQANFESSVDAAAALHFSQSCRDWSTLTAHRGYARHYSGELFTSRDSEIDDLQNEGMQSIIALASLRLPAMPEWE
jgi:hypothetical protein